MNIYTEVPMLTLGNIPTKIVEVLVPTPVTPKWVYWIVGILVVAFIAVLIHAHIERKEKAKYKFESERIAEEIKRKAELAAASKTSAWGNPKPT